MINKELLFVTSCGIYENPDRVMAVVNTEDENLLAKLRAFDTTGELLEIVYSSRAMEVIYRDKKLAIKVNEVANLIQKKERSFELKRL